MRSQRIRRGQSMIELSFVALAVIAGIVIGGPYLLDSINSHFKIWDTAVSDSTNDRLVKANKEDLNIPSQACVPQGKAPGSCGDPRGNCQETQRFFTHQYTPVGCRTNFSCEDDSECCSIPQLTLLCWRKNDPQNGARLWASTTDITADVASKGFISCYPNGVYNPSASNCKNGDQLYQFSCGNKKNMFIGLENRNQCLPVCNWSAKPDNSTKCPDQGNRDLMLDSQDPDIIAYTIPCSANEGACQVKCDPNTRALNGRCAFCGDNIEDAPETCDGGENCTNCACNSNFIPSIDNRGCECPPGYIKEQNINSCILPPLDCSRCGLPATIACGPRMDDTCPNPAYSCPVQCGYVPTEDRDRGGNDTEGVGPPNQGDASAYD